MERKLDFKPCVLWVGGDSFVQIVDVRIKGITADLTLEIKVVNKLNVDLVKIEYDVLFYDSSEMCIQDEKMKVDGEAIEIKPNRVGLGSRLNITKSFPNARRAEVKLLKAYFKDGKSIDLVYEHMEKYAIAEIAEDDVVLLRKVAGDDAMCIPAKLTLNWRCVCGYFNGNDTKFCSNCMREQMQVFTDYRSIEYIKDKIEKEIQGELEFLETDLFGEKTNDDDIDTVDIEEEPQKEKVEKVEKTETTKKDTGLMYELKQFFSEVSRVTIIFLVSSGILLTASIFIHIFNSKK